MDLTTLAALATPIACIISNTVGASVIVYTNASSWQSNVGAYEAITFTELPEFTWIDEQYSHMGVHFTDGSDQIYHNANAFIDDFGLNGALDSTTLEFDQSMTAIATDFIGIQRIKLFSGDKLLYTSPVFQDVGGGSFGGLISTQPFDKVILEDPFGGFIADNLYFGPPIPAPPAIALLGVAALFRRRRPRRG